MKIKDLEKYLNKEMTIRCGWSSNYIDTSFETMPSEFINYAELDLQSSLEHKYINALSNAKRALDCQADRLLKLFGYYKQSQEKYWGFPRKIELIQKFEIIAPRVLNKINKTRNLMEHQYIKPEPNQVEDFLDVVLLFIASTEIYVSNFIKEVSYINEFDDEYKNLSEVEFRVDNDNNKLIIKICELDTKKETTLKINKSDKEYIEILKTHIKKIKTY